MTCIQKTAENVLPYTAHHKNAKYALYCASKAYAFHALSTVPGMPLYHLQSIALSMPINNPFSLPYHAIPSTIHANQ